MPDLRRSGLTRRTPLARGAGPIRRTGLQRSGQLRRSSRPVRRAPLTAARHPAGDDPTRFPQSVIAEAYARAGERCERCPQWIGDGRWAPHHRRPKGAGGSSLPDTHTISNCLAVCVACHVWIHDNPAESEVAGWLLPHPSVPADRPVLVWAGRRMALVRLSADGTYGEAPT